MLVHARQTREAAVRSWLMLSATDYERVRGDWDVSGVALLRCGALFAAVRIQTELIHAAADSDEPKTVNAFLAEALYGGPVFVDQHSRHYYALVPTSTPKRREWQDRRYPGAECLGHGTYLGVPRPEFTNDGWSFSYWCVPMDGPGALCGPDAVSQLVAYARHRMVLEEARRGR
ncbi:hypothetical protein DIZ27_32940 [Streptomyces sp. NWU339]|nr:hypothetical protein DIZ27_32940 [Streptomyces sp. NWU339]